MQYFKASRGIKPVRHKLRISSFDGINCNISESLLPFKYSPLSYNFRFGNGELSNGMGFSQAKLPSSSGSGYFHTVAPLSAKITGIWLYKRYDKDLEEKNDTIVVRGDNNQFYYTSLYNQDSWHLLSGITSSGRVNTVNYRLNSEDVLLISSEFGSLWVWDGINSPYKVENAPKITSMCIHYERVYATVGGESNEVWFSDDFNPLNWNPTISEGGFIQFHDELGRANKVVSFLDHIYIFRDYGINRLSAYGEQSEFSMTRLYISTGKIYPDSVCICGDRIIFLAEDGLWSLDGVSVRKICEGINPLIDIKKNAVASFHLGKYYLSVRCSFKDENSILCERETNYKNNAVIECDLLTGIVNIARGMDVNSMISIESSILLLSFRSNRANELGMLDNSGGFFNTPLPKYWRTPRSDLGFSGVKNIREVNIITQHDIVFGIAYDNKEEEYYLQGSGDIQKIKLNCKGKLAHFYIKSNANNSNIFAPEIVIDYV